MRTARLAFLLPLAASLALAGCGGSDAPPPGGGGGGDGGGPAALGGGKTLGKKMPEYTPCGIKEDVTKWKELKSAVRYAKKVEEQDIAKKALADFLAEFPARWESTEVPGPEAYYYAVILQDCGKYSKAAEQAQRYLDVAPDDAVNYLNATTLKITCLAQSEQIDAAERELKAVVDTVYKGRDGDRKGVEETIAASMMAANRLDLAAEHYEVLATGSWSDVDDAVLAVDCWLRLGKVEDARRVARKVSEAVVEGNRAARAKELLAQVDLIGKPAPSLAAVKWWKGSGVPVTAETLKGKITLFYVWNMQAAWNSWFHERLLKLAQDFADKDVQIVGLSRLAQFDANKMTVRKDMSEEEELTEYDMWARQYKITWPLGVAGLGDDSLVDAWAGHYTPYYVLVGKDGNVFYMRTGKNPEQFDSIRTEIDEALKK